MQLRAARQLARKLFDMADDDSSGFLDKDEVIQVERRLVQRCPEVELVPPFDPDKDFSVMDKDGHGFVSWSEFEGTHAGVSRPPAPPARDPHTARSPVRRPRGVLGSIADWWMNRTGDAEPSCPVLPEAMVTKMDEVCEPDLKGWDFMRERLKALVSMQRLWGEIGDLYKGSMESLYTQEVLPPFVRGPDSKWTRRWCVQTIHRTGCMGPD